MSSSVDTSRRECYNKQASKVFDVAIQGMTRKKTENYVNNKEFLEAITIYRNSVIEAKENGQPRPRVPNYIGDCFLKIATHLSYKPNFVNYMFREDMICDGIENCLQYIDNFDPNKSKNPFAYFTQIIYYAFLRRIQKEKKQLEIKNKILENINDADNLLECANLTYENRHLLNPLVLPYRDRVNEFTSSEIFKPEKFKPEGDFRKT